jgi:hypothetical protein
MRTLVTVVVAVLVLSAAELHDGLSADSVPRRLSGAVAPDQAAQMPHDIDSLVAPIALYPDQLLAQILVCAGDPASVTKLNGWLKANQKLKGSELQDAAVLAGFEPSFVALALFPTVIGSMAAKLEWTTLVGQVFIANRSVVFASIQKLRAQARDTGTLKTTPQQDGETRTTSSGEQVIVIEPANPQVIYVPQYNSTVVYTQAPTTTTVVVENTSSADAAAAGLIGFTAGIAIGAAVNNNYYYGPHGWYGGGYMYNDAWNDYYDAREDARDDWQDHREDLADERGDRAGKSQEQRTERQQNRTENRPESQAQREQRRTEAQGQRDQSRAAGQTSATQSRSAGTAESRGYSQGNTKAAAERSGTKSDAFSGYSSGRSERAASSRGTQSRSSSGSRGGGRRR